MAGDDGTRITAIFPIDQSGKRSEIRPHGRKVHSGGARGKRFKRHPLPLALPHPGLKRGSFYFAEKRNFLLCVDRKTTDGGGLPRRRLQPVEVIGGALRIAGGGEDRTAVMLEDFE
jgi:hypothetical protein